jgi:hypothetical protein
MDILVTISKKYADPCPKMISRPDGYWQSCSMNNACFPGYSLAQMKEECCSKTGCKGFSFNPRGGGGCIKPDLNCGVVIDPNYMGYKFS